VDGKVDDDLWRGSGKRQGLMLIGQRGCTGTICRENDQTTDHWRHGKPIRQTDSTLAISAALVAVRVSGLVAAVRFAVPVALDTLCAVPAVGVSRRSYSSARVFQVGKVSLTSGLWRGQAQKQGHLWG
jgi:hypothetical protein